MVDLRFQIDVGSGWRDIGLPRNWKEMKVQLIWDQLNLQLQLQSINFEWVKTEALLLDNYFQAGLFGGTGIMEGPGLRIWGSLPGFTPQIFFDGCINTKDRSFNFQNDIIKCPIKESGRQDWFYDQSDSFTLEHLTSLPPGAPGRITRADYKQVPYAISSIPDYTQAMLLSISLFIIVKESVDVVAKIASLIARAISQSLSWLQLIGTIIEIVLYLVYLVAIIKASAILIQEIADNLIQPKKTKLCMREVDILVKGLEYMGLTLISSIYGYGVPDRYQGRNVNQTTMPIKIKIPVGDPIDEIFDRPADETTNPKSYGYFDGTFKKFVQEQELTYHAKFVIRGNVAYFEEENNFDIVDAFRLQNEGVPGNTFLYPQPYGTNASEIPAVYELRAQKDDQDLNTYNDYKGTYALAIATPAIVHNPKNQLLSGSVVVDLPFALARRKVGFTKIEKKLLYMLDQYSNFLTNIGDHINKINTRLASWMPGIISSENVGLSNTEVGAVVGILTGQPVFSVVSIILGSDGLPIMPTVTIPHFSNDRIGWMLLSSDFTGVRKRFVGEQHGDDWYISANNESGSYVVTSNPLLNGFFTGTVIGIFGASFCSGNVINGIVFINAPAAGLGPGTGIITGTITGYTGTFTAVVHGVTGGAGFTGTGAINSTVTTVITTAGYGSVLQLMTDFHFTALIDYNQWLTFEGKTFKFSMADFMRVNYKNILTTADGRPGKFQKLMWELFNDLATDVDYRIKYKYTNNYNLRITTDGG